MIRLRAGNVDAKGDAADTTTDDLAVADQLDSGRVALMKLSEIGFLEIAVDPERIDVDDGDCLLTDSGKDKDLSQKVGDVADWSVLLPIAWPESISNQKNKTACAIDTIATVLVTIVKVLILMLVCASRFRTLPRLSEVRDLAAKF
jgi:hypothetical protein